MNRHAPLRPIWICTGCAHPWPCEQARTELPAEYAGDRRNLAIDLADLLGEASRDLSRLYPNPPDPVQLYGRFLGWVRRLRVERPEG